MQHRLAQQFSRQRVHQRLQLNATLTDPLRQGRAGDRVPSALEDRFLAVQRKMVQVLGDQHLGQQAGVGKPMSMTCGAIGA